MLQAPFHRKVLFPVDLRYGWDVSYPAHQALLTWIDRTLRPYTTSMEPRCKHWSLSGNSRDPQQTKKKRTAEQPMLMFATKHCLRLMSHHRHFIWGNPIASAMWTQSAADTLNVDPRVKSYTLDMCRFSPAPDGQRHKKRTKLKTSLTLTKVVQKCTCRKGHTMLQGFGKTTHQARTAQAAMYFKRYCYALCADLTAIQLRDSHAMTTAIFNEDEQDIPGEPVPADADAPAPPVPP